MVDVLGHLGLALIWLSPSWFLVDRPKTALTVVLTGFWFGMVPDVDLVVSKYVAGVHHHGVFHTVLAVLVFAAVLGPLFGLALKRVAGGTDWFSPRAEDHAIGVGVVVVLVAGLSHIFGDILSAPDISTPIEPLWPLYDGAIVFVDVLWYKSFWATWALFLTGLGINLLLGYRAIRRVPPR